MGFRDHKAVGTDSTGDTIENLTRMLRARNWRPWENRQDVERRLDAARAAQGLGPIKRNITELAAQPQPQL